MLWRKAAKTQNMGLAKSGSMWYYGMHEIVEARQTLPEMPCLWIERMLTMSAWIIILTVLQLLTALATVLIVLFQSGKSAGLSGAIGGVADTFLAKNKAKTLDAKLAKYTKWVALAFVLLTLLINIIA